MSRDSS